MIMYNKHRIKILIASLILLTIAVGYILYGLTRKCGGFEGISCPRGFRCNLTEEPGYVVYGDLDNCIINLKGYE